MVIRKRFFMSAVFSGVKYTVIKLFENRIETKNLHHEIKHSTSLFCYVKLIISIIEIFAANFDNQGLTPNRMIFASAFENSSFKTACPSLS
jgi:hypothetical protein